MSEGFWTRDPDGRWMYLDRATNQPMPWPPSNDDPNDVQIEIWAAELAAEHPDVLALGSACKGHGMLRAYNGYVDRLHDTVLSRDHDDQEAAGWLAQAIHARDEDEAHAWTWDPARPVAGQYDEWLHRFDGDATPAAPDDEYADDGYVTPVPSEATLQPLRDALAAACPEYAELVAVTPHDPTGSPILDGIDQSEPGETTELDIEVEK